MAWINPEDVENDARPSKVAVSEPTEQASDDEREAAIEEHGLNARALPDDIGKASDDAKFIAG